MFMASMSDYEPVHCVRNRHVLCSHVCPDYNFDLINVEARVGLVKCNLTDHNSRLLGLDRDRCRGHVLTLIVRLKLELTHN